MYFFYLHKYSEEQTSKTAPPPQVAVTHPSSYAERLKLCKVLRGFQVRSITINRAVKYMNAGDDAQPTS